MMLDVRGKKTTQRGASHSSGTTMNSSLAARVIYATPRHDVMYDMYVRADAGQLSICQTCGSAGKHTHMCERLAIKTEGKQHPMCLEAGNLPERDWTRLNSSQRPEKLQILDASYSNTNQAIHNLVKYCFCTANHMSYVRSYTSVKFSCNITLARVLTT